MSLDEIKAALEDNFEATRAFVKSEVGRQYDEMMRKGYLAKAAPANAGTRIDDEREAWIQYLRSGERIPGATKAMSIGSNPDGGYAVPKQLSDEIVAVQAEQGAVRKLSRVYTSTVRRHVDW